MPKPIHVYVSSSPELYAEREVVGEVIAGLPVTIGWRIGHSPIPGEVSRGDVSDVAQCDICVLVLGHDFAAPMGAELRQAMAIGRAPLAFRLRCTRSPSAQDAVRRLDLGWREYSEVSAFRSLFERDLLQAVLRRATPLGLDLGEVERLMDLAREAESVATAAQMDRRRGDAGRSGVILGREIWDDKG